MEFGLSISLALQVRYVNSTSKHELSIMTSELESSSKQNLFVGCILKASLGHMSTIHYIYIYTHCNCIIYTYIRVNTPDTFFPTRNSSRFFPEIEPFTAPNPCSCSPISLRSFQIPWSTEHDHCSERRGAGEPSPSTILGACKLGYLCLRCI